MANNIAISKITTSATELNDNDLLLVSKKGSGDTYTSAKILGSNLKASIIDSSFNENNFYIKYANGIVIEGGKTTIDFPSTPDDLSDDLIKDVTLPITLSNLTTANIQVTGNYQNANLLTSPYPCDYTAKLKNTSTLTIILDHSGGSYTSMNDIISSIVYNGGYKYAAKPGNIPSDYDLRNDYYLDGDPNNKTPANIYRDPRAWLQQAKENIIERIQTRQPDPITADWLVIGKWK